MSSKVIKWFKRQASIRRFTEKKDEHKTVLGSKEPSDEKRKLSFGRLSFRKKHKRKPSNTAEIEGNLAIVGISKKYSYSVPNEMEGEKVLTNGATNAVSLDNSSCTNSPTKTDSTSKSVSELSYHSSFDNEAHSSEFSREFDNTPLLADSPKNESVKLEAGSCASKLSDTFHTGLTSLDKSALETDTLCTQTSSQPDQTDLENSSNLESLSPQITSAEAQIHPQDIKRDKTVIPTIVIESVPNKPPLAVGESYSSDDLSGLSEIDDTDMNKDYESVISLEENVKVVNLVENAKSGSNFYTEDNSRADATSTSEIPIALSDSVSSKEINNLSENIKSASNSEVKESSCAEVMPLSEITIAERDNVTSNAGNDVQSLNSFRKSEENISINCVKEISVNNHKDMTQQKLHDDTTPPSSCDSVSSVINMTELQTLDKDKEVFENGSAITNENIPIPDVAQNTSDYDTKSESPTTDNLLVREKTDSPPQVLNSSNNTSFNEKIQVEVLDLKRQVEDHKNLYPKLTEEIAKDESVQSVQVLVRFPEPRNQIAHTTPTKNTTEYPEDLNPFGDDTEEEESSSAYPSLAEIKEISSNPFGSDSEHNKNIIYPVRSNGSISGNSESISSSNSLRKISSSESKINKKSLNPFGDSDDESNDDRNDSSQTLCKGEIPPRLPPKSDFQKRKYSGASLAPVPRPRKTKQHHGSTTSLQNVSTFPVPAPRSVTPFGSTKTLNESVSSMNPFDEDEADDPSCGSFERRGMGRNTTQLQSTSSEGERNSEESFARNGVRASLPSTGRFRPKKKRQAPLPPGTVINKPPHSPMPSLVNSIYAGHRKRSSTSPSSDVVFEVRPRRSKSPSPRRTPPPRPPLPSQ